MMNLFAGLRSQIKSLKDRLKALDTSKKNQKEVKEVVDALNALEERYAKERSKREEKRKAKEEASKTEVEKEALTAPVVNAPGAATPTSTPTPTTTDTSPAPTPAKNLSCALCGGMTFNDDAAYQQHMSYTHASDTMPTSPAQPAVIKADVAPAVTSEKEDNAVLNKKIHFKLDQVVKPVRGSESKGRIMRHDSPEDLAYVMWEEGALKDRDGFGGYYPNELSAAEEPVEAIADEKGKPPHNPGPEHICPDCKDWHEKHADLKSNFDAFLNDLKEERKIHYEQGNNAWVARLDQKIQDLEKSMVEKFPSEKQACPTCGSMKESGAENAKDLTIMDHTPPQANSGPDAGGTDSHDEFQDEWALPAGIELQSKLPPKKQRELDALVQQAVYGYQMNIMDMNKVYQAGEAAFIQGQDVISAVHTFLDGMVAVGKAQKTSALKPFVTEPTKLSVFNKEFLATPVNGQKKFAGYDISQNGKKLFNIKSKNSQPMTKEQLEFCAQIELTRGYKQAKLVEKIAFLEVGSKVYIVASDKSGKRVKFASMEQGVRGWAPASKFAFIAKEGELRKHKDHIDNTYGHNGKEILVDCPNGSGNVTWIPLNELLPIQPPPATPESLNEDLGAESAKDCADCHGNFTGTEGEKCPTCGRFAVQKEALKTALPPVIPNERGYLSDPVEKKADQVQDAINWLTEDDAWKVKVQNNQIGVQYADQEWEWYNPLDFLAFINKGKQQSRASLGKKARGCDQCDASMINGVFCHETGCPNARKEREQEDMEMESSLHKLARVVHHKDGWHVLSEKGKNLGGPYKSKGEAVKRLRQVEYFKHHGATVRPFSKKAEVLVDPYQVLSDHITDMKSRMNQVQERLQSNPVPKTAGENESDNSSIELPELFEDLSQGIDLLETKLNGENSEGSDDIHESLEELENLLWEVELKAGIKPELPEHEKEEPEHKEIVKEVEEKTEKEAAAPLCSVDGCKNKADSVAEGKRYCYTHSWGKDPKKLKEAALPVVNPVTTSTIQNVQPTDDDNLEVSVVAPTSPPPPGQKWVFDTQFNKYVLMPDPAAPGKTI